MDNHTYYLLGVITGLCFGLTLGAILLNVILSKLSRGWRSSMRRIGRTRHLIVDVDGAHSPDHLGFVAHVRINNEYVLRIFGNSSSPITLKLLDRKGDEILPTNENTLATGTIQ